MTLSEKRRLENLGSKLGSIVTIACDESLEMIFGDKSTFDHAKEVISLLGKKYREHYESKTITDETGNFMTINGYFITFNL